MDRAMLETVVGAAVIVVVLIQWVGFVVIIVITIACRFQEWAIVVVVRALNQNMCIPRQNAQRRRRHPRCQDQL